MKKLLSSLLCLAMLLPLAACNGDPQDSQSQSSSSSSSSNSSSDSQTGPKVITAEGFDPVGTEFFQGAFTEDELYVSQMLTEAMVEHEDKDVLFRVIVMIAYEEADEEVEDYTPTISAELYNFAVNVGATNIVSTEEANSSDIWEPYMHYFMEIPREGLEQMIEHRGYLLRLAPPKRVDGYDARIADILTVELNSMNDNDTLHVAVTCTADSSGWHASDRAIPYNQSYNADLVKAVRAKTSDDVKEYVDEIVERNNLNEKRVYNPEHSDYGSPSTPGLYENIAGFEAILTKPEIIALAQDPEVKVIYSMNYAGVQPLVTISPHIG